jgi:hypothetical protein
MFIRGSRKPPRAKKLEKTSEKTIWQIIWPTGKTYRAIVMRADSSLRLETWCKAQVVADATAVKITPQVLRAIATAEASK